MEKMRRGRPKSDKPTRNKTLSIKVTPCELEEIQKVCIENNLRYIDVIKKGLEFWSRK